MRLTRVLRTIPVGAPGLLRDLYLRGFVHNVSKPESLHAHLESAPRTLYVGIDPSATNLHLGHLFPIICVNHFIHAGHRVVPIVSSATTARPPSPFMSRPDWWRDWLYWRPFRESILPERVGPCCGAGQCYTTLRQRVGMLPESTKIRAEAVQSTRDWLAV